MITVTFNYVGGESFDERLPVNLPNCNGIEFLVTYECKPITRTFITQHDKRALWRAAIEWELDPAFIDVLEATILDPLGEEIC